MTEATPNPRPGDDLRAVMTEFATGVAVVTTHHDGVDHAVTINSLTSVSLDPPLVLICVGTGSRFAVPLRASGIWGISILAAGATDVAWHLARRGPRSAPPLEGIAHHTGTTGTALLDQALSWLECRTHEIHEAGDHLIVVGEVVSTSTGRASRESDEGSVIIEGGEPLVHWRGEFRHLG